MMRHTTCLCRPCAKTLKKLKNDRYLTQANPVVSLSNALWNFVTTPSPSKENTQGSRLSYKFIYYMRPK